MDRLSLVDIGRFCWPALAELSSDTPKAAWRLSSSSSKASSTSSVSCAPCLGVRGCILTLSMDEVVPRASLNKSALGISCREETCFGDLVAEVALPLRCLELIRGFSEELIANSARTDTWHRRVPRKMPFPKFKGSTSSAARDRHVGSHRDRVRQRGRENVRYSIASCPPHSRTTRRRGSTIETRPTVIEISSSEDDDSGVTARPIPAKCAYRHPNGL